MKKVDRKWLKEHNVCPDGFKYWCEHCEGQDTEQQLLTLVKHSDDWAYWILTKLLNTAAKCECGGNFELTLDSEV